MHCQKTVLLDLHLSKDSIQFNWRFLGVEIYVLTVHNFLHKIIFILASKRQTSHPTSQQIIFVNLHQLQQSLNTTHKFDDIMLPMRRNSYEDISSSLCSPKSSSSSPSPSSSDSNTSEQETLRYICHFLDSKFAGVEGALASTLLTSETLQVLDAKDVWDQELKMKSEFDKNTQLAESITIKTGRFWFLNVDTFNLLNTIQRIRFELPESIWDSKSQSLKCLYSAFSRSTKNSKQTINILNKILSLLNHSQMLSSQIWYTIIKLIANI